MDVSNANLEPYRRYVDFHDRLDTSLKVLSAAAAHAITTVSAPNASVRIGDLIKAADSSWQYPPVWDHHPELESELLGSIAQLGIMTVWSALDDFRVGAQAEISRWEAFSGNTIPRTKQARLAKESEEDDGAETPLHRFVTEYGWRAGADKLLIVLSYFGLLRNCIAHRLGRASSALAKFCRDECLHGAHKSLVNAGSHVLPQFAVDEAIVVHPKLAILYLHLGNKLTVHINTSIRPMFGADGVLNMAAAHAPYLEYRKGGESRSAEATLNRSLAERYLVWLVDNHEAPKRMRDLGIWTRYEKAYASFRSRDTSA